MTTEKEKFMFLGMDLENVPEELKVKACKASDAFKRTKKAREQNALWAHERVSAENELAATQADFNNVLSRWDPDTNTLKETLEEFRRKEG